MFAQNDDAHKASVLRCRPGVRGPRRAPRL